MSTMPHTHTHKHTYSNTQMLQEDEQDLSGCEAGEMSESGARSEGGARRLGLKRLSEVLQEAGLGGGPRQPSFDQSAFDQSIDQLTIDQSPYEGRTEAAGMEGMAAFEAEGATAQIGEENGWMGARVPEAVPGMQMMGGEGNGGMQMMGEGNGSAAGDEWPLPMPMLPHEMLGEGNAAGGMMGMGGADFTSNGAADDYVSRGSFAGWSSIGEVRVRVCVFMFV